MITKIFSDPKIVTKIQTKLPQLFQLAELDSSRAGRLGMEVGSARERILIALLIHVFGLENIETAIPITEPEVDVQVNNNPISIKTMTGRNLVGVKLIWTVDAEQAFKFSERYIPGIDMLLIQINWGHEGGFYYFPATIQQEIFEHIGRERYLSLPKPGTNPRGVEISTQAIRLLASHQGIYSFPIHWHRQNIEYDPYQRWLDYWQKEE